MSFNGKFRKLQPSHRISARIHYSSVVALTFVIYLSLFRLYRMLFHSAVKSRTSTPLYWSDSEHTLFSRILGVPLRQQCPYSFENVIIPPIALRRGRIASLSNEDYLMEATEFVHNIRLLLGVATQAKIPRETVAAFDSISSTNIPPSLEDVVIMDYGCGSGRFLIGLLSANVCFQEYIGVDVNSQELHWLGQTYKLSTGTNRTSFFSSRTNRRKNLKNSAAAERMRFIRVDVQNERYNKKGRPLDTDSDDTENTMIFPVQLNEELAGTVDVMILRSVFSQMLAADMYHHLVALYPILKAKSGIMVVSLFLNSIPSAPVETVVSPEDGKRGKVLISKDVFEKILYETGFRIRLYLAQWNSGEDVYVLSTDGIDPRKSSLIQHDE
jgi:hypothetical protein